MTWFKVDDGLWRHPKLDALRTLGDARCAFAVAVWTLLGSDSADQMSDGVTSFARAQRVSGFAPKALRTALNDLVHVGLMDVDGDEYRFHDWSAYQPNRADIEARRAKRAASGRLGGLVSGASKREASASASASATATTMSIPPSRPVPSRPVPHTERAGARDPAVCVPRSVETLTLAAGPALDLRAEPPEALGALGARLDPLPPADVTALGAAIRDGSLAHLARNGRETLVLADLAGYHRDFAPLAEALAELRRPPDAAPEPFPVRPTHDGPTVSMLETARSAKARLAALDAERKEPARG